MAGTRPRPPRRSHPRNPPAPGTTPPSSAFRENFPAGQRVEVHDSYRLWLESWLPLWKNGEMLTIDYGGPIDRLYHRRPRGTLRAYLLQQRLEGPEIYQNPGLQDLTADVNFTDLFEWCRDSLHSLPPEKLSDFLRPFISSPEIPLLRAAEAFQTLRQSPRT